MHGEVQKENTESTDESVEQKTAPSEGSDGGGTPDGCGSGQSFNRQTITENDAAGKEADTSNDLAGDSSGAGIVFNESGKTGKKARTQADERVGTQSSRMLSPLPFQADH